MIFISEIGLNYNSKIENCEELIKQSKIAGADIAKFQLGWKGKPGEINFLDKSRIAQLYSWSEKYDIEIMFSVFNHESLELLKQFPLKRIKIASRTLVDNLDLCKEIVSGDVKFNLIFLFLNFTPKVPIDATGILFRFKI